MRKRRRSGLPAMYKLREQELSKGLPLGYDQVLQIGAMVTEICRHGASTLDQLALWLANAHSEVLDEHPIESDLLDHPSAADHWMARWREMQPVLTDEQREAWRAYSDDLWPKKERTDPE